MSKATSKAMLLPALVLALMFFACGLSASGQETPQPGPSPAPAAESPAPRHPADGRREGQLLVKEEEGEVDPNVVFRHSTAVRMIAAKTGLSIDQTFWLCMALNFIVIFGVLWFLLRKIVPTVFRNRAEAIQRRLEEARKASDDARRRLSEVETRLSRLDVEIEEMRREAEASSHHEEERVMAAAEEERRRIVQSAEQEIARAANAARRELKAYTAELGVSLAEKKIRIAEGADQQLVRDFTARLGRDGN
jgi:F-type H+-transporting ATPase subunit b